MEWDSLKQGRYYKVGQVLKSGATFVTKRGKYYKSSALQNTNERNGGGQQILAILEMLQLCNNHKK